MHTPIAKQRWSKARLAAAQSQLPKATQNTVNKKSLKQLYEMCQDLFVFVSSQRVSRRSHDIDASRCYSYRSEVFCALQRYTTRVTRRQFEMYSRTHLSRAKHFFQQLCASNCREANHVHKLVHATLAVVRAAGTRYVSTRAL